MVYMDEDFKLHDDGLRIGKGKPAFKKGENVNDKNKRKILDNMIERINRIGINLDERINRIGINLDSILVDIRLLYSEFNDIKGEKGERMESKENVKSKENSLSVSSSWLSNEEVELIIGMINVQITHAQQCDNIRNRPMAIKQKGKDMARVALLKKILYLGR